ncbi:uncharacterized protein LOC101096891 [Prionailurus iriomotensis]
MKFRQKALKQTKQKKSKSAEFLMVKEDREATEGIGNPAFNVSSPDLLAHQTSDRKVIRRDTLDRTLAAHQQKCRLLASAEPKGNEYSRNYFDPLMDEEINPRQCGMEVSREASLQVDTRILNDRLMKLFEERGQGEAQGDLKCGGEGLSQYIPMSCLNTDKTFDNAKSTINCTSRCLERKQAGRALYAHRRNSRIKGSSSRTLLEEVERGQEPQHLQVRMKCARGLKNKAPRGSYRLRVSLLGRPGGCVFQWQQTEQLKTRTHPVRHDGNFYDLGLYFHESLYVALPPKKDVKPGMAFLFELCLLRGKYASFDWVVGWAAFPVCDNNFDVVDGKFKCPLLRGHYDQKFDSFRKMEDLMCQDLDHWLCNLYFQVIKLPLCLDDQTTYERQTQLPPEFPVSLMAGAETAESGVENTAGLSEKQTEENICSSLDGSISNKFGPCPMDCDLNLLKEDRELHKKEKSAAWRTGELEDYSEDVSYLEELEKHRFSVWCSSVADGTGSREFFKHLHFGMVSAFHFSPFTVELCYPSSSLAIKEELLVVVVGPLMLNAVILPLVLIRWGLDTVLGRLTQNGETPIADAAKLYWVFVRTMQSGILGVMLTVLIYILLFIISSLILYLYCLRLHNDSWILDVFQRIHSEETKFFIPYDLEISNQELSYIVKRSEQWRGINGDRRKVAVYDYIWKNHGFKSRISSCDLQKQNEISVSALGPGDIISHVSIYTVYPSGFQELYRHFLRLPSGAIVEVCA